MSKQVVKVAIIGCGAIASLHVIALRHIENAELVGIYDKNVQRAKAFATEQNIACFSSMEELLSSDADVVAICTPSGLHADLSIACLEAGKHVMVEKPIAITEEGCRRILEAEKKSGKLCTPVSQLRFYPDIRRAKEIIDSRALGKPVLCDLYMKYYREPAYYEGSWRGTRAMDGGGALMNQGIHGVDALRFIMGDIRVLNGTVRTQVHNIEVEDTAVATVQFENGAIGVIEGTTSVHPGYPRRIEIHCEKGSLILEENRIVAADLPNVVTDTPATSYNSSRDPMNLSHMGHQIQYENLFAAIEGREPLFYTAQEGVETVRTILAIYRSSDEGRCVCPK